MFTRYEPDRKHAAQAKGKFGEIAARTIDALPDAIGSAMAYASEFDRYGLLEHCGYGAIANESDLKHFKNYREYGFKFGISRCHLWGDDMTYPLELCQRVMEKETDGLSQSEIAEELSVSAGWVNNTEST